MGVVTLRDFVSSGTFQCGTFGAIAHAHDVTSGGRLCMCVVIPLGIHIWLVKSDAGEIGRIHKVEQAFATGDSTLWSDICPSMIGECGTLVSNEMVGF